VRQRGKGKGEERGQPSYAPTSTGKSLWGGGGGGGGGWEKKKDSSHLLEERQWDNRANFEISRTTQQSVLGGENFQGGGSYMAYSQEKEDSGRPLFSRENEASAWDWVFFSHQILNDEKRGGESKRSEYFFLAGVCRRRGNVLREKKKDDHFM